VGRKIFPEVNIVKKRRENGRDTLTSEKRGEKKKVNDSTPSLKVDNSKE